MEPHLLGVEREVMVQTDHQLSTDDEPCGRQGAEQVNHLREITAKWLAGFRAQLDGITFLEGQAAKPIPFWFVLPGAP
jgi:hypothetical protein